MIAELPARSGNHTVVPVILRIIHFSRFSLIMKFLLELLFDIIAWVIIVGLAFGFIVFIIQVIKGFNDDVHGRSHGSGLPWL